jgi:hypothetical protein
MELLRDDPIIECAMRTGYAPWIKDDPYEDEEEKSEFVFGEEER